MTSQSLLSKCFRCFNGAECVLPWLCSAGVAVSCLQLRLVGMNLQSAAVRPEGRLPTPATDVELCSNLGMQCVLVFELCCWLPFPCLCLAGTCP